LREGCAGRAAFGEFSGCFLPGDLPASSKPAPPLCLAHTTGLETDRSMANLC
jgi:hypothetical protein